MNKTLNHHPKSTINIIFDYLLALIPLLLYGIYKNLIIVYNRHLITHIDIIKFVIIILLTISIPIITNITFNIIKKEKITKNSIISWNLLYTILFFLAMPVKYNKLIYLILLVIFNIIITIFPLKKLKINSICLIKIISIIILIFVGGINYANTYEVSKNISYNLFDSFFGRTVGSFGATNIFFILLGYTYLSLTPHYKKEIPFYSFLSFIIFNIFYSLLIKEPVLNTFITLISTNYLFSLIYIATIPMYSPYPKESIIIYSCLIGIFTSLISKIANPYESVFIAILIASILNNILDKFILEAKRKWLNENS